MMNFTNLTSKKNYLLTKICFLVLISLFVNQAFSQTTNDYRTNVTGAWSWSTVANWQRYNGTSWVAAADYPGQNPGTQTVTILNNTQVTLNVSPVNAIGSLALNNTASNNTNLTFGAAITLSVTGTTAINNTSAAGTQACFIDVTSGVLNTSAATMNNSGNDARDCSLRLTTGTITVTNSITMSGTAARNDVTFSGAGLVRIGGTMSGGSLVPSTGTVEYNSTGAAALGAYTYNNLTLSNAGAKTLAGTVAVGGNFLMNTTSSLDVGANLFTVTGISTINGQFIDTDDAATANVFTGKVTIGAAGTWSTTANTVNTRVSFRGGFENNNTTTNSVLIGACRFITNNQSVTGTGPITFLTDVEVNGNPRTVTNSNTNTITVNGTLDGSNTTSIWLNDNGSYLIITGTVRPMANGVLNASTATNTVRYTNATTSVENTTYYHLIIDANVNATLVGTTAVAGDLLTNASSTLNVTANIINVTGTTTMNGLFLDLTSAGNNICAFTGKVTVTATGTWNTSINTATTEGETFAGGFENNNTTLGSVNIGSCNFITNNQLVTGTGPINFVNSARVAATFSVTNSNTNTITVTATLNGVDAASSWVNANGSYLLVLSTTRPMNTGVLNASAFSNTVTYTASGANVKDAVYSNLIINVSTSASIAAATTVNDFLYLTDGTFTVGAFLTMGNGATISRNTGNLSAAPSFGALVNVIYTAASATGPEIPVSTTVLNNLTLNTNGGNVTLGAATAVNGTLTWSSNGLLILETFNLTMGTASSFSGNNSSRFIQTNSSGNLIKQGTTAGHFQVTYPVGTSTNYTPMQITSVASGGFGAPGNVTVRAVSGRLSYVPATNNAITKYWAVSSSFAVTNVNVNFTFINPAELVGAVTAYEPRIGNGVSVAAVTGPSAVGAAPAFSSTGHNTLTGDWTYVDPTPRIPKTYYTYQSGNWSTANVWTEDPSGTTLIAPAVPGSVTNDNVVILNGRSVFTNIARSVNSVEIRTGGTLDIQATTGHSFGSMSGGGTLKVKSSNLPGGLNNASAFVSSAGGTIEYYDFGGAGTNLPSTQTTYNNLTISNSTGTNNTLVIENNLASTAYTLNGNLVTSATSTGSVTLQFANTAVNVITMYVAGNITNGTNCNIVVGNFNAIHAVTVNGNFTNNGIVDWCNTAQWVAATDGAINLVFTGASDKTMMCNGQTDIYSLGLNMGTDDTYILDLNASAAPNFGIFTNGTNITITKGTLKLGSGISLLRLGVTNAQYSVLVGCKLWIDGASVLTNNRDDGILMNGGIFQMSAGTANFSNVGINIVNSGQFIMSGGTVTANALINGGNGAGDGTFNMSGGVLNLDDALAGAMVSDLARFSMPDPNANFTMSGGTINIYDPNTSADIGNAAISIGVSANNTSITGGTWNLYIPASANHFGIASNIPFYDLNIYKEGAGTATARLMTIGGDFIVTAKPLVVLRDFTIDGTNSPIFDANGNSVTVGGNFNVLTGGTYRPNGNTTTFNGPSAYGRASQTFSINTQITGKTSLVVSKSSGTLAIAGTADFDCLGGLTITQGTLDDGGKNLDVCEDIANSATHIGTGSVRIQRGVKRTNITAGGSYALPTMVVSAGAVTTPATFSLTIKDGIITAISVVSGGTYATNGTNRLITFGSGAATAKCETVGGTVANVWLINGGSGYGPTASAAGGGGAGAVLEAVITGNTSNVAGTAALSAVNVVSTGEGYTSNPTITISSGAATAVAVTTDTPTISGSGSGVFANLYQNNDMGSLFSANQTVTKDVRLAQGVMNIASYNLALSGTSNVYDALTGSTTTFTNTKMIQTNGLSSNAGLTKTYSASMLAFTFPVGSGGLYTPGRIALSAAPTVYGDITIRPVASEHPLVSATGQSLTYYWKTTSSGMVLGPATVTHTYDYDQSDVVDNGGTVVETAYVPGRYNSSSITWTASVDPTKVDDAVNNRITFDEISFLGTIDGDYTAGDRTPSDPFAAVLTFYSKNGSTYDWNDPNAWSIDGTLKHLGAVAGVTPTPNSVVKIGDGMAYNHTVVVDADSAKAGSLTIELGSKLNLSTFVGHNLGNYVSGTIGNGTLSISSGTATTAEFPAGDFVPFLNATGGTVEYYTTGAQDFTVPAISVGPSSVAINNYNHLIVTPATGRFINMPNTNLTVYGDLTVQGASATGTACLNSAAARSLAINGNLRVNSGNLQFRNGFSQSVVVGGNATVSSGAIFNVNNTATGIVNTMTVTGNLTNNGTLNMAPGTDVCDLTFIGIPNTKLTGTNGAATTTLNKLTVNKGTTQVPELDVDVLGTLTTPSTNWLTLTNGTFKFSKASLLTIENAAAYAIDPSVCLAVNNTAATVNVCFGNNSAYDLSLAGKIQVINGTLNVGTTSGNSQDIVYAATGTPEINVQAGNLYVNGQVRRSTTSAAGDLIYAQSGGTVTIVGRNSSAARGRLEVLNNGSFTMGASAVLTLVRPASTLGDLHLEPATSSVDGTIIFGTTNINVNRDFRIHSSVALKNVTVAGVDGTDLVNVDIGTLGLTINGTLTVSNNFSAFRANGYPVIFTSGGVLVNSNTNASTGTGVGGYQGGSTAQVTTFNSSSISQTITGIAGNLTNFGTLVLANTSGSVALAANSNIRVNGDLTMSSGILADGGNTITVIGNVANSATHSGAGRMALQGSVLQTLSGNGLGIFQNLEINNSSNVVTSTDQTVNGVLTFSAGILDIDDNRLTLGVSSSIAGTLNATRQIITNGTATDLGLAKNFNSGAANFTFPVSGTSAIYAPVNYNITANSAVGTIIVRPVNTKHPSTQDAGNKELLYYWNVASTGFSGLTATHTYTYDQSDVQGTESNYNTGRYVTAANDWSPVHGYTATVNNVSNTMTLAGVNFLDGDYTAGESDGITHFEFDALKTYYSRNVTAGVTPGAWDDVTSWSTDPVLMHTGPAAAVMPNGHPIVIASGHTITANGDIRVAATATISGLLDLADYVGHNLKTTSGTGTIKINATSGGSYIFPAGNHSAFTAAGAGTFEFGGAVNGAILPTLTTFNNIVISGTATKTIPAATYSLNGNLTINGGTLSNTNNSNISVRGNWINNNVVGSWIPGTSITTFNGSGAQTIGGTASSNFYRLVINNTSATGVTLNVPVVVTNSLTLTDGLLYTSAASLLTLNDNVTSNQGSAASFVHGPMKKIGNDAYVFPVGKITYWRRIAMTAPTSVTTEFTAEYIPASYSFTTPVTAPLTHVSKLEFWQFDRAVTTDAVRVTLYWEDATYSQINNCSNLQIARWNGAAWVKHAATTSGSCAGAGIGSIQTNAVVSSFSPFTFASESSTLNPLPIELTEFNGTCKDGNIELKWSTATELNNDYFTIERSIDAQSWDILSTVKGAGNSSVLNKYSFKDSNHEDGNYYYRLKQTDFNLDTKYSKTIYVENCTMGMFDVMLTPNPSNGELYLSFKGDEPQLMYIDIYNYLGQKVYHSDKKESRIHIDNQPNGIYSVYLQSDSKTFVKQIVIER